MKDFLLTASIGLGLIVGTGIAAHAGGNGATGKNAWHQPALTSQQKLQIFPKLQQLQLDHIKYKEQQLQAYERCISTSGSYDNLQKCRKDSRQSGIAEKQSFMSALRTLYGQYGITLPEKQSQGLN